jgi:hypothetical protein
MKISIKRTDCVLPLLVAVNQPMKAKTMADIIRIWVVFIIYYMGGINRRIINEFGMWFDENCGIDDEKRLVHKLLIKICAG